MSCVCCARQSGTASRTSPSDMKCRPSRTSSVGKRGENCWMPNLVKMTDGVTSLFLNPEPVLRYDRLHEDGRCHSADTSQKTTNHGSFFNCWHKLIPKRSTVQYYCIQFFQIFVWVTLVYCASTRAVTPLINPLNAELNAIYHVLALLGAHHILHISGIRVNDFRSLWKMPGVLGIDVYFSYSYPLFYFRYPFN
jgi:hypothetical protein